MAKLTRKEKVKLEDNAIRRCSEDCYFFKNGGTGCNFYKRKEVKFSDACLHDLTQIKEYVEAFTTGNNDKVKEDAAGITGMIMLQIRRMLEQVNIEGVTVLEPMTDNKGSPVWIPDPKHIPVGDEKQRMMVAMRVKDHPLISRCIQLARAIDINLSEFKLTPKSADEKRQVSGHIIAENPEEIADVMKERQVIEDKFLNAIPLGNQMTKNDPVYQKLLSDGEIIE